MEALFVIVFIYFVLNAIYLFITGCIYSAFGDEWEDGILVNSLVIGLIMLIHCFSVRSLRAIALRA